MAVRNRSTRPAGGQPKYILTGIEPATPRLHVLVLYHWAIEAPYKFWLRCTYTWCYEWRALLHRSQVFTCLSKRFGREFLGSHLPFPGANLPYKSSGACPSFVLICKTKKNKFAPPGSAWLFIQLRPQVQWFLDPRLVTQKLVALTQLMVVRSKG